MEVKICDLCGGRINTVVHYSCKVKKPRKYKWINLVGYKWSDIEICNKCATIIADMAQKKDRSK